MVMVMSTATAGSTPLATYTPEFESVNTITIQVERPQIEEVAKVPVKRKPRMTAFKGESQEVIDSILKTLPPIMVEVARCESGLNPLANRVGVDLGLFQINQIHRPRLRELGLDEMTLEDNLTFANMLYESQGLNPWYMSEHCWRRYA